MKKSAFPFVAVAALLTGCIASAPPITNPDGQTIKFADPVLGRNIIGNARFVLIEKDIGTGKFKLVSMSNSRMTITNARQERVAFSNDLTSYAPDYTDARFYTYNDSGNYNQQTVIMDCRSTPSKTNSYSPCNSEFGKIFIPMGITKAYVAGQMSSNAHKTWEDPAQNIRRYVSSPSWALKQAGVFERLTELKSAN